MRSDADRPHVIVFGLMLGTLALVLIFAGVDRAGGWRAAINAGDEQHLETWDHWLLVQASAAHRLLGLMVVPIGQTVDYDYDALPQPRAGLTGLSVLSALGATAWRVRRRYPLVTYGLAWVLIVIAPRLVIQTPRSYLSEHQMYAAIPGAMLVLGGAVAAIARLKGNKT